MSRSFIAKNPTPLYNRADFPDLLQKNSLPVDEQGLFRPLEMIALPGTKFTLTQIVSPQVAQVTTGDYPHGPVYLDLSHVEEVSPLTYNRARILPPPETILERLKQAVGLPYIWGGNWSEEIPGVNLPIGVDCSGLLYQATSGFTPRNTSQLLNFGKKVEQESLQPLDLILWQGHVIIALNASTTIESLLGKGVIIQPLKTRLSQISPQISYVIRRFI